MIDLERRALVAFPPVGEAFWSGIGPVGLLRYRAVGVPAMAIAVRVVSPFPKAGEPWLPGVPVPAWSEPAEAVGAGAVGFAPLSGRELVPFKDDCDVGIVGTLAPLHTGGAAGTASVTLDVRVGDTVRGFGVTLSGEKVELGRAQANVLGGGDVVLGPREIEPFEEYRQFHLKEDHESFRSAQAPLRFSYPEVGTRVAVESSFFSVDAAMGFEMFVRVDYLDGSVSLPRSVCDGVTFDLDRGLAEWVFRAVAVDPAEGREIERIVVAAFAPGLSEERARVDAWLPHARFAYAAGPRHVREQAHPEALDEDALTMARYSTWDTGHFASTLPIEEVAQIQVELLRGRGRGAVLEAHGISEYQWGVEERAAMERLAEAGLSSIEDGDAADGGEDEAGRKRDVPEGAREDVARYRAARARALAEIPFEGPEWSVADYAGLRAALEVRNPIRVLEKAGLEAAELVALDFAMAARLEGNAAERLEYEECFERALAKEEAAAEGEDDFSPPDDGDDEDEGGEA